MHFAKQQKWTKQVARMEWRCMLKATHCGVSTLNARISTHHHCCSSTPASTYGCIFLAPEPPSSQGPAHSTYNQCHSVASHVALVYGTDKRQLAWLTGARCGQTCSVVKAFLFLDWLLLASETAWFFSFLGCTFEPSTSFTPLVRLMDAFLGMALVSWSCKCNYCGHVQY
jgi:hypothetical protein